MKTIVLALLTVSALLAATAPAGAATVIRDGHGVTVVERGRAAPVIVKHHRHRVVIFDRFHHRHVEWR